MRKIAEFLDNASEGDLKLILSIVDRKLNIYSKRKTQLKNDVELCVISEDLKHLSFEELIEASKSFEEWNKAARTGTQKRSRARIYFIFLLIRYGALRLGEVLTLDDRTDFDRESSEIIVKNSHMRRVQIPEEVMSEILEMLDHPVLCGLRGGVSHLDQGYIRRKFYERAKECNIPRSFFNPRAIRHSRAVELLRGGVPLRVVNSFLGQPMLNTADQYFGLPNDTASRIVQKYLEGEFKMRSSARNAFTGKISKVVRDDPMVEVEIKTMKGYKLVAIITAESFFNLQLAEGMVATASIKAPEIIIAELDDRFKTSARNCFRGKVESVKSSDLMAEVLVELSDGGSVCSVMTSDSTKELDLKKGKDVTVLFKAFSVVLNKE